MKRCSPRSPAAQTAAATPAPFGIAAGPDGEIWFCEAVAGMIGRSDPRDGSVSAAVLIGRLGGAPGNAPNLLPVFRSWVELKMKEAGPRISVPAHRLNFRVPVHVWEFPRTHDLYCMFGGKRVTSPSV